MAKKQAFTLIGLTGSVNVTWATGALFVQGTLLELSEEAVTLKVKRPRSSKSDVFSYPLNLCTYVHAVEGDNEAYLAYRGQDSAQFDNVTITQIANGALLGTIGDDEAPFIAAAGTWTFTAEAVAEEAEKPSGKKKPAAEPEPDEADEGDDEEEFDVGNYVTVTDSDDEEVTGTIKTLTAKKLVVTDDEGESHTFKPDDVTVAHAEKPKATKPAGKKPAAKEEAKDEAKPARGGKANKKPAPAEDDAGDWGDDD